MQWASLEDTRALEEECTWAERDVPVTLYQLLTRTKNNFGSRPAVSYQLTSGPKDKAETLSWNELHQKTTQTANMFRAMGVGPNDVVALHGMSVSCRGRVEAGNAAFWCDGQPQLVVTVRTEPRGGNRVPGISSSLS